MLAIKLNLIIGHPRFGMDGQLFMPKNFLTIEMPLGIKRLSLLKGEAIIFFKFESRVLFKRP